MHHAVRAFKEAILVALGFAPEVIAPGRLQRFATCHRRSDRAGWCRLFEDLRGGVYGCHRQGIGATWSTVDRSAMTREQRAELARRVKTAAAEREREQLRQWAANGESIAELWSQCVPVVPGDPVALYLKRRGLGGIWPYPKLLRLHRSLPHWHDGRSIGAYPAMIAPVTSSDGGVVALHRTWLSADGRKADVPSPKKLTRTAGPLTGACIALHRPVRGHLGIAEGVETALAAWCASAVPTVAAYCAESLAAFRWPVGVTRLVIFADADKAGRNAADRLRTRALAARLQCEVITPTTEGADWCDVWAERDAILIESQGAA